MTVSSNQSLAYEFTLDSSVASLQGIFVDVFASPHGCEEFFYSNVPTEAAESLGICGGGVYREVWVLSYLHCYSHAQSSSFATAASVSGRSTGGHFCPFSCDLHWRCESIALETLNWHDEFRHPFTSVGLYPYPSSPSQHIDVP